MKIWRITNLRKIVSKHAILLMFIAWSLWLSSVYCCRGPLSVVRIHCNADSYVSRLYMYHTVYRDAPLTSFEPVMCGADRMADYGMPSIFELAACFLPVPFVYLIMMFLQRCVAGYFTYRFLRGILGIKIIWSVLGGLAFTMGATRGHQIGSEWGYVHFLHEPGFPLLLYCVSRLSIDKLRDCICWAILVGLLPALSSQVEIGPFFTLPCAFLFGLIARTDVNNMRMFMKYLGCCGIAIVGFLLYQWPHFLAAFCHLPVASRTYMLLEEKTWTDAWNLICFRFQYMWVHVVLMIIWLFKMPWRCRRNLALSVLLFVTIVIGAFLRPVLQLNALNFGFLSSFNFDRLFLYAPFFVICAAVSGLNSFRTEVIQGQIAWRNKKIVFGGAELWAIPFIVALLIFSIASWHVQWRASLAINGKGENWHRLYSNPELKALAQKIGLQGTPVRTVTVGAKDSIDVWQPAFNLAYGLETVDGFKMIYPWRYHQFWRQVVDHAYHLSENNLTRRFMDVDGSRMFLFPTATDENNDVIRPQYNLNLLSLANVGYFISNKRISDERLKLVNPVYTGKQYKLWLSKNLFYKIKGLWEGDYLGEQIYIYENTNVCPRFYTISKVRTFESEESLLQGLQSAKLDDLRTQGFLLRSDWLREATIPPSSSSVKVVKYTPRRSDLIVTTSADVILAIINNYSPFWRVICDNQEIKTFPLYHTFIGVIVPVGIHNVRIEYFPPYAKWLE